MTKASRRGFGYVNSSWIDEELEYISSDSNLSSTSLLRNLIEPTSSEEFFFNARRRWDEEKYHQTRETVRDSLAYVRRTDNQYVEGMNLDYDRQIKKEEKKTYERQSVPVISEKSRKTLLKRQTEGEGNYDFTIPFLSQMGENSLSLDEKSLGPFTRILDALEGKHVTPSRRRSQHLKMKKLQLDEIYDQASGSEDKMKGWEENKLHREEDLFRGHSEDEKRVIKESLGRLAAMKEPVFIPFGKDSILNDRIKDSERFFEDDESSPACSYNYKHYVSHS